ncbi:MAG: right-handed parallel beta-helix repeat-containing protein [Planctomycetales bacterium]|nr:right-handed parallel beta-helix repeat-containing protein [Planctomycetales bacterium]
MVGFIHPRRGASRRHVSRYRNTHGMPTEHACLRIEPLECRHLLATLVVDTLIDEMDGSLTDGDISLRDAVMLADTGDTINFASSLNGGVLNLTMGQLPIRRSMRINGLSLADGLTIDAGGRSRIMNIDDGDVGLATHVELFGLFLTGGRADVGGALRALDSVSIEMSFLFGNEATTRGGAIYTNAQGNLSIYASSLYNNSAGTRGGGIYANAPASLRDSHLDDNSASAGGAIYGLQQVEFVGVSASSNIAETSGGAVGGTARVLVDDSLLSFNAATTGHGGAIRTNGPVTIANSELDHNSAGDAGGGIWTIAEPAATVEITNSSISGNTAVSDGGGVRAGGGLTVTRSRIEGNTAERQGGGLFAWSHVSIMESQLRENSARDGGGVAATPKLSPPADVSIVQSLISGNVASRMGGGVAVETYGDVNVTRSTLAQNFAGVAGGGMSLECYGDARLENSTISGNSTGGNGGGLYVSYASTPVEIVHNTITENVATGAGGGLATSTTYPLWSPVFVANSIVAANHDGGAGADIYLPFPQELLIQYSLIGDNSGTSLEATLPGTPDINGNLVGDPQTLGVLDPLLRPMQDVREAPEPFLVGHTPVHVPLAGSPTIDAADADLVGIPATDQRGHTHDRVYGERPDMGAYEIHFIVVDTKLDETDGDASPGHLSLREAMEMANVDWSIDAIHFAPELAGETIVLTQGVLTAIRELAIDAGNLESAITIDASESDPTPDEDNHDGSGIFSFIGGVIIPMAHESLLRGFRLTGADSYAMFSAAVSSTANLTISHTEIYDNSGVSAGGISSRSSYLHVTDSVIEDNTAWHGGGIASESELTVTRSSIVRNHTNYDGGGIVSSGWQVTIEDSVLAENSAGGDGGGIYHFPGSLLIGFLTITGSTLVGNEATLGGGVYSTGRVMSQESTFAQNTAERGGAIYARRHVELEQSTLSENMASEADGGAAIYMPHSTFIVPSLIVKGSIVAGNFTRTSNGEEESVDSPQEITIPPDGALDVQSSLIGSNLGLPTSEAPVGFPDINGNLVGDPTGGGVIDAKLTPLGKYGGRTPLYALTPESPAMDGVDPTVIDLATHDQRGAPFARLAGARVDMGAFEFQNDPLDYDLNGTLNTADVDALAAAISAGNPSDLLDLTGNAILDDADLDVWLALAGLANLASRTLYARGDANLDGSVDGIDFGIWFDHHFQPTTAWSLGDFNADGVTDGVDFDLWNRNKFLTLSPEKVDFLSQPVRAPPTEQLSESVRAIQRAT